MNKLKIVSVIILSLYSSVLYSQQPDLSGDWVLNLKKSKLEAGGTGGLEKGIVKIIHDERDFRYWRVFIIKGREDILTIALPTGGQEKVEETRNRKVTSSLSHDQDTLIYSSKTITGKRESVYTARYYLIPDSAILITDERITDPGKTYRNILVFDKK